MRHSHTHSHMRMVCFAPFDVSTFLFFFFLYFPDGIHIAGQNPCGWVRVWVLVVRWWWFHAQIGHMSLT